MTARFLTVLLTVLLTVVLTGMLTTILMGCMANNGKTSSTHWDFDHNIQFEQKLIKSNFYYLKVHSTSKTHFSTLATFLMRRSLQLCKSYGFKIEVLQGVEGVNDSEGLPNLIMGSLAANIECKP